jgi:tetratricopeptide (TPR) repeat protein
VDASYTRAVKNAVGAVTGWKKTLDRQREAAGGDVDRLLELPPAKRLRRVYHYRQTRLLTRATIVELCARSLRVGRKDPLLATELCALANEICLAMEARNPPPHLSPALMADLKALVQAHAGNARRLLQQWEKARGHFTAAHDRLLDGTGDGDLRACVFSLHASLLVECRHFEEALWLLTLAQSLYRRLGDSHAVGKVLMKEAIALREMGQVEAAIQCHIDACVFLDEARDPWIVGAAWINLAVLFHDVGRYEDAWSTLKGMPDLTELCGTEASILLNQLWVEGIVLRGLERYDEAVQRLRFVHRGFVDRGCKATAALVMLDLTVLFAEIGQGESLRAALEEAYRLCPPEAWREDTRRFLEQFRRAAEGGESVAVLLWNLQHIRKSRTAAAE